MKTMDLEYNNSLKNLEKSLYNGPIEKEKSIFGYYSENVPESSWEVINAHTNQIFNKTATNIYRMADNLWGWAIPEKGREELQLKIEQLREEYIDTENNINKYLYNYANGAEVVGLSIGGQLYRGLADPVNQAINWTLGPAGFFIGFLADATQYIADTSFYENRDVLTDPTAGDAANLLLQGGLSVGTMKMQQKYTGLGNDFLYSEKGNFKKIDLPWEKTSPMEEKYVINIKNPDEFMPSPLDKLLKVNDENPELLKVMQTRGYNTLMNMKNAAEIATRQRYGQPQDNYGEIGFVNDIHNYLNNASRTNKAYQDDIFNNGKGLRDLSGIGPKPKQSSDINIESDLTHAVKPLRVGIENNFDQIYAEYARELCQITGYNKPIGEMLWDITQGLNRRTFVDGLLGRAKFKSDSSEFELYNFITREFNDYSRGMDLNKDYSKAVLLKQAYDNSRLQAYIRDLYKTGDIERIKELGAFVGKKKELTKEQATLVGLPFDENKLNRTERKGLGNYNDFALELKEFQGKIKDYARKEKEANAARVNKEVEELRNIYSKKAENIKKGKEGIGTERKILKEEIKGIRQNRDLSLEENHKNIISEKEKINTSYKGQITEIKMERDSKIKEVKSKISEIRKAETADLNKIQKDGKLYDPDKLPLARKIQRKNSKLIRKLKDEITEISKEYGVKISELEKKQKSELEVLNKKEIEIEDALKKGVDYYSKNSKKVKNKFIRRNKADIKRELKKLQVELDKKETEIIKKYKGKEYNKYNSIQRKLNKVNGGNYKGFYKHFKKYEDEFKEIKTLGDIAKYDSKIVETNTYSIDDNPIEITHALFNDLANTNKESKKVLTANEEILKSLGQDEFMGYNPYDYRKIYHIMEEWGNDSVEYLEYKNNNPQLEYNGELRTPKDANSKSYSMNPVDSFLRIADGFENDVYETFGNILSENAERKAGMNELKELIENLRNNDEHYSRKYNFKEQIGMRSYDPKVRNYMIEQLEDILHKNRAYRKYKPNFWIDPKDQKLNSNMARRAFKGLMSVKYLANFNYLREIPQNNFRIVVGANRLGWKKSYSMMQDFTDIVKLNYEMGKNFKNIKNQALESIPDPKIRRRAEIYIDKKLSNSLVWNDVDSSKIKKGAQTLQRGLEKAGEYGALGQTLSDAHRIEGAEFATINYMLDILPEANSPLLKKILDNNGIKNPDDFLELTHRLKTLGSNGLMELVWSGKRADNLIDYRIQSLFEQFADVMGKEFNAYQRHDTKAFSFARRENFLTDAMLLYKRYSLGAIDGFVNNFLNYIDDDGIIKKRFSSNLDFKSNLKNMFRGFNSSLLIPFAGMSISTSLIYGIGVKWLNGTLFGGPDDEIAEAKLQGMLSIPGTTTFAGEAMVDTALNYIGADIALGGRTVLGGYIFSQVARAKRAASAEDLDFTEKISLYIGTLFEPEPLARAVDSLKFGKNIPNRLTTFQYGVNDAWKYDKKIDAKIEQIEGEFPAEKIFSILSEKMPKTENVNWSDYWEKRPQEAREFLNAPDNIPNDVVTVGAAGVTEWIEQSYEISAIAEQMTEPKEIRERNLKVLGLDIESQLKLMSKEDNRDFNIVLSLMQIRDEEEILMLAYNFNKSKDKKEFLKSIMSENEYKFLESFKEKTIKNKSKINSEIKKHNLKGIDGYIKSLDLIYELSE